ncbi:MAG: hypothetical protein M1817_004090, partial [Caeruleum heppii]
SDCACGNSSSNGNVHSSAPTSLPESDQKSDAPQSLSQSFSPLTPASNRVEKPSKRRSSVLSPQVIKAIGDGVAKHVDALKDSNHFDSPQPRPLPSITPSTPCQPSPDHDGPSTPGAESNEHAILGTKTEPVSRALSFSTPNDTDSISNGARPSPLRQVEPGTPASTVVSTAQGGGGGCCSAKAKAQSLPPVRSGCCGKTGQMQPTEQPPSSLAMAASPPSNFYPPSSMTPSEASSMACHCNGQNAQMAPTPMSPNAVTTIYTFPPTYSTFQHPLTPDELAFLQNNPRLFTRSVPLMACQGANPSMSATFNPASTHRCNCGDTCDCLGCAAHPYNTRTLSFVRSINDVMSRGYHQGGLGSRPQSMDEASLLGLSNMSANTIDPYWAGQSGGWDPSAASFAPNMPFSTPGQETWQGPPSMTDPTSINSMTGMVPFSQATPTPSISRADDADDEPPISPSAFFHVAYPTPDFGHKDGVCFCGEGCTCVGCMVHDRRAGTGMRLDPLPMGLVHGNTTHPPEGFIGHAPPLTTGSTTGSMIMSDPYDPRRLAGSL